MENSDVQRPEQTVCCTLETVNESLKSSSSLPPAEVLQLAPASELTRMIEHPALHSHLAILLPAACDGSRRPGTAIESNPEDGAPREQSRRMTVSVLPTATRQSRTLPQPPL